MDTAANLPGSFVLIHPFRQLMKARAAFNSAPGIVFNVCLRADCSQLPRCAGAMYSEEVTYATVTKESKSSRSPELVLSSRGSAGGKPYNNFHALRKIKDDK